MRLRILVAAAAAALVVAMMPSPASAQVDGTDSSALITANINALGSRAVTAAAPISITSGLNSSTATGSYNIVVTEITRNGSNPWTVTGSLAAPLTNTDVSTLNDTIANTAVTVSNRAQSAVGGGGTPTVPGTTEDLSQARTLVSYAQDTGLLYNGAYTLTGDITVTPPTGSKTGVYTATFVVDLTN
jgi:hypothetical protein